MKSICSVVSDLVVFLLAGFLFINIAQAESKMGHSQGADLVFGGTGTGPGEFTLLIDMAFDPQGNLYTLECGGPHKVSKTSNVTGVGRVQKFDSQGKFISQFPLGDDIPADVKAGPRRMAIDASGNVYVSVPVMGIVRQYGPDGKKIRDHALVAAAAIGFDAVKGRVAAIATSPFPPAKGKAPVKCGGDQILLLDPNGGTPETVPLAQEVQNADQLVVDKKGSFYIQGGEKRTQIFVFDEKGQSTRVIGSPTMTRNPDGSEPIDNVGVDSQGNIYNTGSWENPVRLSKYSADGTTIFRRVGQFKYGDTWNGGGFGPGTSGGMIMAIAPDDRMWIGVVFLSDPDGPNFAKYSFHPAILRTEAKFFDPKVYAVKSFSTKTIGLVPSLVSALPDNVTQTLDPIKDEFVISAANRNVKDIDVTYHVYDYYKNEISHGNFHLPLKDGEESRTPFTFTPPKYGWYAVEADISSGGERIMGSLQQIGVTPVYADIPVAPADFLKGWGDVPRQVFCGLSCTRLSSQTDHPEKMDAGVAAADKDGAVAMIMLTGDKKDFSAEKLRATVEHFKGHVKYYELMNEPNFAFSPQDFAAAAKPIYQMVKEVDPQAQVMGPSTCGINLPWIEKFYQSGGGDSCDIVAIHDYEGHESIQPEHWRWKYKALHDLMAKYGQDKKDLWQTERAISGVRGYVLVQGAQAVRCAIQRNLDQTLGVASEHNNHYYVNEGGYAGVPSYIWDTTGPHPAAFTLRTREALVRGRKYTSEIDFGPTGNKMLLGLRFEGGDGPVVSLENFGASADIPLDIGVKGGDAVEVVDSFGNVKSMPVKDGSLTLPIPQLPVYLHLKPDQAVSFPQFDFGRNIAPAAKITYSGRSEGSNSLLNDGVLETHQGQDPNGDTNGLKIWKGEPLDPDHPQFIDLQWQSPRSFDSAVLFTPAADNSFCALLDYDLQIWQDNAWKTISKVRTPVPESDPTTGCTDVYGVTWLENNNFSVNHFPSVTSDRLRIVMLRATYGLLPDEKANEIHTYNLSRPMFREIEVYGPKGAVQIAAHIDQPAKTEVFASDTVKVTVTNSGTQPFQGAIQPTAPEGWTISPDKAPVTLAAGATTDVPFTVKPPADVPVGDAQFDFEALDAQGNDTDFTTTSFVVTAPFVFHQDPLGAAKGDAQPVVLGIFGTGPDPVSGTIHVELAGPDKVAPIDQSFGPTVPGQWLKPEFDLPIDIKKGSWTVTYSVTSNHLVSKLVVNLAQREWSVIGPFADDIDTVFGPEAEIAKNKIDLTQNYTDTFGIDQKWQQISDDTAGKIDMEGKFGVDGSATAYAAVWVNSPKARKAEVSAALNKIGKIWVNGKLVVSRFKGRGMAWGQDQGSVDLQAGENLVLVKVIADSQKKWEFLFDLLDPDTHKPLDDISFSPKPQS